jgi:steroid 5-alpha reductase family enzyme
MDVAYPLVPALPIAALVAWRGSWSAHELVTVALALLWSLRLSLHIGVRNIGHGEDRRYAAWRSRFGAQYWWWSYFMIFAAQGVTVWLWVLPLTMAVVAAPAALGWQHALALVLFAVGFFFQAVGDVQLERFKKQRTDRSMVLDTGVWSLTRHPNYFGEVMIWWSFGALGLVHPWGWVALLSPAYVTWMMSAGSATPMQERYLAKTKPAYADYMRRVPAFFPWSKP